MARLITCGFEQQQVSATAGAVEGEGFAATNGAGGSAPAIDTSVKRSGAAALRLGNKGFAYWDWNGAAGSNDRWYYFRTYFRFSAAPSAQFAFLTVDNATHILEVKLNTDRTVRLYRAAGATAVGSASSALSVDTWYRVELGLNVPASGTSGLYELRIDGTVVASGTVDLTNSPPRWFIIGDYNYTQPGINCYFDDVALNDDQGSAQNSWPGTGAVLLLKPVGDNNVSGWGLGSGGDANWYGSHDNTPPTGAASAGTQTQTTTTAANTTDFVQHNCTAYATAGVPSGDVLRVIQGIAQVASGDTTPRTVKIELTGNPTVSSANVTTPSAAVGSTPSSWKTGRSAIVYDSTVTRSSQPWIRLTRQTSGGTIHADFAGVIVEYGPPAAKTQSVAVPVYLPTAVQPWSGGRFYENDCASNFYADVSAKIKEQGSATAPSTSGGAQVLATNLSTFPHYTLRGMGSSNNGQTELTVDNDVAVCADVGAYSSNCAAAANILLYQDANNWYRLEVAKTAGGTSTLYKKSGGVETSVATVAKGVALNALARAQIYCNGSSNLGIVVDGTATTYTDSSPLAGPFNVYLGAPASTGTSDNRVDNIAVVYGTKVRVFGCPTGGGAAIYNSGGTLIASASESSGTATVDLVGQQFPFTGYVQVCSTLSPITPVTDGRYPASGTLSLYGGDDFYYAPTGLTALTASSEATYGTTQTGSHNGIIVNGNVTYGVTLGPNASVIAFTENEVTGQRTESVIGQHVDMHDSCDVQADSSGILHFIYGGVGGSTKYRKSNTPWSITDLGSETDLGENFRGSLLIDASDNLYVVGTKATVQAYDTIACKKRTAAGSWQSTVIIANAAWVSGWYIYPCDAVMGRDGKIHAMWMAYSAGSGFEHAFHAKSADGSTWTGITGTSLTLPLSQNTTTGKLSDAAAVAADGDYGVSRLTVDSDGTVHAVIGRNASTYAYFKGDPSTGWPASPTFAFTGTVYSNHGAIERFGDNLVYITCWPGYNALTRWGSSDDGVTWSSSTMLSRPTGTREAWWWPKLTPVPGATYTKVLWQGRGTVYGNKNGASPLSGAGIGALYTANVSVVIPKTVNVAIPVFARVTQTQGLAVAVVPPTTNNVAQTVAVPVRATITLTQPLAIAVKTVNTTTQGVAIATAASAFSTYRTVDLGVRVKVAGLQKTQTIAVRVTDTGAPKARIMRETYVDSAQFGVKTVESDTFGERTTYIHPESTIS